MITNDLQLIGLSEDQRQAAAATAKRRALAELGPAPTPESYAHQEASAYPAWLVRAIGGMLIAAFAGAFALSMFNVFSAGRDHAAAVLTGQEWQAAVSGAAVVLLSEFLTITSVLAGRILLTGRRRLQLVMALPALLGVALALTANATIARPVSFWEWLITVAPPVAVLFLSLILEAVALDFIRRHHAAARAHRTALLEWQRASAAIESQEAYNRQYAIALWETLTAVNRRGRGGSERAAALAELPASQRRALVQSEIAAAAWWEPANQVGDQEAAVPRPFESSPALELPAPAMASGNGNHNGRPH